MGHCSHHSLFPVIQIVIPFQEDSDVVVEQNMNLPDYLPEDESPSQEQHKAVTRLGSVQDGVTWLSTAANFLSRSFYWWPDDSPHAPPLYSLQTAERISQ